MNKFLVILLVLLPVLAFAQPTPDTLWTRTYGGSYWDGASSVQQTTDGGYIVAGSTYSFGAGGSDFYLVKTNSLGWPVWTRTYGGSQEELAYSVQQTADGGYIVAGYTKSFGVGTPDYANMYLVKTDGSGNTLWTSTYGGSSSDGASSVQQTADGGYIVAGTTRSFSPGGWPDMYLVKTNSSGIALWTSTYGGSAEDYCYSVRQTADGGYILAGYTTSFGAGSTDCYLVKTNSSGTPLWTRTYGGSGEERAYSVRQTADGGYILAGWTTSFGAGGCDCYLVKTDGQGNPLWTRTYGGSSHDYAYSVQQTVDGGYIVAGETYSFGAGTPTFTNIYLVKTNSLGEPLWTRTYGGPYYDGASSVQQTADGGYIVAGGTNSFGAGLYDFYLVKTGPEYPGVGYVTLISPGPPDWGYRLHWVSGALSRLVFTNFCSGTMGSVSGAAATAGWTATNYTDSIVFASDTWLSSGSIDTFWLSHPYCSDYVTWTAGDSSGTIEGPLPVELTTFEAIAGDEQVMLRWRTESELDNDHFVLYKHKSREESFRKLTEIPGHGTTAEPHDYEYVDRFVQNGFTYEYQISDVDITGRETIHEQIVSATPARSSAPLAFALYANYPNPFNPTTTIRYDVKETGLVSVKVFDLLGREVATLVHATISAGSYSIDWDAGDLPSGVYLCRMETQDFMQTRKVVLLK